MQNDQEIGGGGGYDFTMKTALYVARVIHHDLRYADAESWSWWRACGGNYKDGLIRVFDRRHQARDSKLLWAMGNYSRFVRPGAIRYATDDTDEPTGLMLTAYRNTDGGWVVVVINYAEEERPLQLKMSDRKSHRWQLYRTSDIEGENLKPVGNSDGRAVMAPRSVTTWVEVSGR